jgi:methionyl-tRNA formyltransferase
MARVVFMGTPDFAVPSLAALLREGQEVIGVLTRPDRPAGRGQRVEESPVKELARANGLLVQQPGSLRNPDAQAVLAALAPDVIVVAAYGLILPQAVLDLPPHGCLNVHGSLLPRHRGAAPIAAAILAGDSVTGISLMRMDAGLDTGPVLATASLPIEPDDTTGTLTGKLANLGAELLAEMLPAWLRGKITPVLQDEAGATYAPRIGKEAGEIHWGEPAEQIARKVRAYAPWPSAYTAWGGQRLKIIRAHPGPSSDLPPEAAPGQVIDTAAGAGVVTGSGILVLDQVQLAGKRILPIDVFLRGAAGFLNSRLPSGN